MTTAQTSRGGPPNPTDQGYRSPPPEIAELIDTPETPTVSVSPDRQWLLLMERPSLPSIASLAAPEVRLAGVRLNPRTNGPSRNLYYTRLLIRPLSGGAERPIEGVPEGVQIDDVRWSPDSQHLAFTVTDLAATTADGEPSGLQLWVADVSTGRATHLQELRLNGALGMPFRWLPDSTGLLCRLIPADRGVPPAPPEAPSGPSIRENSGRAAAARTYQDLLRNPHDEALFDYYLTTQVARVSLDGQVSSVGEAGVIRLADTSPDGRYVLIETMHRPYSYLVPLSRFPFRVEVFDASGQLVRQIADIPLMDAVPAVFAAVATGPRSVSWRADAPSTLTWVEAQDEGDPRIAADVRDRVYTLNAPFDGGPKTLISLALRFRNHTWGDGRLALVSEYWWANRQERTWIVQPDVDGGEPRVLWDRSFEDRYGDPGTPLLQPTATGRHVLLTTRDGMSLFLAGAGASPEGDQPFLDRLDLETLETERLWRSEPPVYELPVTVLNLTDRLVLTRRESVEEPPNYFVRELSGGKLQQLTHFENPWPQLSAAPKELIRYQREDGVQLTATLYLPPGYAPERDGPLPALFWAYPREFKSADAAGQVTDSPHRFLRLSWRSPLFWLTQGFAILEGPTMPIVGEEGVEPNDTYVGQLVASAKAAVDELVRRGVADRQRIAVGGHSYGAFMAANLLAHSDLFCAGIARSGAYNRTLTPFGFQAEERTLWQAPDVYMAMSPFMHADKIKTPILLIHGEADDNSGTFPIQSERFYNAIAGHGGMARLVLLPHESHAYQARESVLHMLWEMTEWLDRYAKRASVVTPAEPEAVIA
ncbi:MAG TPA: prolyl oligopeptidase family serine peptidase [Chloroflexota bacterium]|nr:prolyl oligopeptidase family serine peptidase [Chloroflexota bacterium]